MGKLFVTSVWSRVISYTPSSDVGTGLLLGGGLSYLSARHGFSVDALVAADVVLVDGRIVTANATNEYSDLFKALKVIICVQLEHLAVCDLLHRAELIDSAL